MSDLILNMVHDLHARLSAVEAHLSRTDTDWNAQPEQPAEPTVMGNPDMVGMPPAPVDTDAQGFMPPSDDGDGTVQPDDPTREDEAA